VDPRDSRKNGQRAKKRTLIDRAEPARRRDNARMTSLGERAPATARATAEERARRGREARADVSRSSHAALDLRGDRDPIALLEAQARSRLAELLPIRYGRMAASPFQFFRGAATVMAHDLASTPTTGLSAQLSGDAHLLNFGAFASPERDLVFDLNDFDETFPGPFEWDVKRLAASFEIAGRDRGFGRADRGRSVLRVTRAYREAMRSFAAMGDLEVWYARLDAETMLARLRDQHDRRSARDLRRSLAKAHRRDRLRALAKLTQEVEGEPRIVSDPPLLVPLSELSPRTEGVALDAEINALFRSYRRTLPADLRALLDRFRSIDLARKVVGIGSVGTRCWVMLLLGRDANDPLFLQIKEAEASVLEPVLGAVRSAKHGRRVVEGQRLTQAASDIFLGWMHSDEEVDGGARDFYVRQLWDWKGSADVETILPNGLASYAQACGWTLARGHARSGDRIAIAAYLGKSDRFDQAIAEFAAAYADRNERDHQALVQSIADGKIAAVAGV
jgi:uncharacterized protein (DUF2252 family)